MIDASALRNGMIIKVEGELYTVTKFQLVTPGRRKAFMKVKLKGVVNNKAIEKTFSSEDKVEDAYVDRKPMQFLYNHGGEFVFMNTENYEQVSLTKDHLEGADQYFKEGLTLEVQFLDGQPLNVILPTFVELKITNCEPGIKGDSVNNVMKPAELETGMTIQVPLFVDQDEIVKVDTRTGEYAGRS
ncbi:MAG: elongation factor P [bacterium]|nr:elongation factor P [bacterium]